MTRGFKYRIYVTPQVERAMAQVFGCCRRVYNDFVRLADSEYQGGRPHPSYVVGWSLVSEARTAPETSWLADVPAHVLAASVKNATVAFDNFFASQAGKRKGPSVGYPRMKRKAARQTARFDENSHAIRGGWQNSRKGGGRLYLAKVWLVRVRWHRPLPSAPSAVTITRETDGRWWATFTVQVPVEPARLPVHPGRAVGVDIGTEDIALVYSEKVMTLRAERDDANEKRTGPQSYRQAEIRLAALDQELSRKTRGSNNRKRTQHRRAMLHTRVKNLRTDFARQMAAQLTSENQVVVVETLGVREMVQDAYAKSVLDTAFATITREVALAAEKRGTTLIEAPRYFAGTRTCSHCGTKGPKLPTRSATGDAPRVERSWTATTTHPSITSCSPQAVRRA